MTRPRYRYSVYGIEVLSDTRLALTPCTGGGLATVEFRSAAEPDFLTAVETADFDTRSESWYRYAWLPDGSAYVRWEAVGEFLVAANGGCIRWRRFDESSIESFQVYLLGQALSFALVKQRLEPLHATVVTVDDRAVAFLGNSGAGKSTLAACFLEAGHRLVTDDLLLLHEESGRLLAYPGPPRLKLFPEIAGRFFPQIADGVAMNVDTEKLILGLDARMKETAPVAPQPWRDLLLGRERIVLAGTSAEISKSSKGRRVVFPGAFNPLHEGHWQMVRIAAQQLGARVERTTACTIIEGPRDNNLFVKFTGPAKTIAANQAKFEALIASFDKQ
jgi:hypothetical protein